MDLVPLRALSRSCGDLTIFYMYVDPLAWRRMKVRPEYSLVFANLTKNLVPW